ncbi:hypothetical protein I302_109001 [Kwoniella bestiolae CBS 10118]|uniref:Cyclin-D1-binding protein 1-like N-terminal domain-containing protein n=1 Tax=Kwoniella bestiolae CBS 10118 TaxID=1296100 RepID=A0A1B9FUP8_9TREE|nr:hypothetical protein I302_08142 [Kwoniella bestiolae CBS 10118]OCF22492.1 hypothetical protein I302_08142 [Kwoniella bestiolae CBS 10118]
MTDPKLQKALKECQKTILTSLKALSSTPSPSSSSSIPPPLGDVVGQLLAQLRQSITALGLSFNPPITIDAAIQQLDKVSEYVGKLISCVLLASTPSTELLAEEWKDGLSRIIEEINKHIQTLETQGDYLSSTGIVWESIDNLLSELSKDELGAVKRRWKGHQGTVKDAWMEFKEILESSPEDQDEDGWDELDLGGEELTEEEKKRAEAAKPLLALHQILHSTIPKFIDQLPQDNYRPILKISTDFVDAYDNAVSSMHPEQDESEIEEALSEVEEISRKLAGMISDKSIAKWSERLDTEKKKWEERRMNLSSLKDAI